MFVDGFVGLSEDLFFRYWELIDVFLYCKLKSWVAGGTWSEC
jgi:hypothetical protein